MLTVTAGDKCKNCDAVLAELEHIDDEAGDLNIHFVKLNNDKKAAKKYNVISYPKLVSREGFSLEILPFLKSNLERHRIHPLSFTLS